MSSISRRQLLRAAAIGLAFSACKHATSSLPAILTPTPSTIRIPTNASTPKSRTPPKSEIEPASPTPTQSPTPAPTAVSTRVIAMAGYWDYTLLLHEDLTVWEVTGTELGIIDSPTQQRTISNTPQWIQTLDSIATLSVGPYFRLAL